MSKRKHIETVDQKLTFPDYLKWFSDMEERISVLEQHVLESEPDVESEPRASWRALCAIKGDFDEPVQLAMKKLSK
jgi:hypothetical protein